MKGIRIVSIMGFHDWMSIPIEDPENLGFI